MIVDYDHIEQKIGLLIESAENRVTYCVYTVFNRNYNGGLYREILSEIGCCSLLRKPCSDAFEIGGERFFHLRLDSGVAWIDVREVNLLGITVAGFSRENRIDHFRQMEYRPFFRQTEADIIPCGMLIAMRHLGDGLLQHFCVDENSSAEIEIIAH